MNTRILVPRITELHEIRPKESVRNACASLSERFQWIDFAKGVGIILVVYGHVARGIVNAGIPYTGYNHGMFDRFLYSFHMPLFFFLSGLMFVESLKKYGRMGLAFRRVDALLYPYLVWSVLQGGIEVLLSSFTNSSLSFTDVSTHILVPRAQFWFLYALFFVSVAATILYQSTRTSATACVLVFSIVMFVLQDYFSALVPLHYVARYLVYFAFGVSLMSCRAPAERHSRAFLAVSFFAFLLAHVVRHFELGMSSGSAIQSHAASLIIALVSIVFVTETAISIPVGSCSWLAYVGQSSMGIYLMHVLTGSGVRIFLQKVLQINDFTVHLIAGLAAGILLPIAGLKLISVLRCRALLHPVGRFRIGYQLSQKFGRHERLANPTHD